MATPGGGSRSLLLRPEAPALNDPARDEAFDDEEEAEEAPLAAPDDKRDEWFGASVRKQRSSWLPTTR